MPSIPAAASSDVYEYTLSKAYSSNDDADENEDDGGRVARGSKGAERNQ